ncbi:MAG: hypothetical protein ACXVNO_00560 [Bacteroidia bacterium]
MNEFYSIAEENKEQKSPYQLKNLGISINHMTVGGKRSSDFWGTKGTDPIHYYRPVKPEDYDAAFASLLIRIKPSYEISKMLDYHLDFYVNISKKCKETFVKQIRYVVLPQVKKYKNVDVYIELLNLWLDENNIKPKINNMNNINIGDINAPAQIQVNSNHSTQTLNSILTAEDLKKFFEVIEKDIEKIDENAKADINLEMTYAKKQIEKGNDASLQLSNIGKQIKEVGISYFVNLTSSALFEIIRPMLGL